MKRGRAFWRYQVVNGALALYGGISFGSWFARHPDHAWWHRAVTQGQDIHERIQATLQESLRSAGEAPPGPVEPGTPSGPPGTPPAPPAAPPGPPTPA